MIIILNIIGKVDGDFKQSMYFKQCFPYTDNLFGQPSCQLPVGNLQCRTCFCINDVRNGFRLGQINPAIEKGTFRKFSRLGNGAPGISNLLINFAHYDRA